MWNGERGVLTHAPLAYLKRARITGAPLDPVDPFDPLQPFTVLAPPRPCRIAGEATRLAGTGHGALRRPCRPGTATAHRLKSIGLKALARAAGPFRLSRERGNCRFAPSVPRGISSREWVETLHHRWRQSMAEIGEESSPNRSQLCDALLRQNR